MDDLFTNDSNDWTTIDGQVIVGLRTNRRKGKSETNRCTKTISNVYPNITPPVSKVRCVCVDGPEPNEGPSEAGTTTKGKFPPAPSGKQTHFGAVKIVSKLICRFARKRSARSRIVNDHNVLFLVLRRALRSVPSSLSVPLPNSLSLALLSHRKHIGQVQV